MPTLTQLPQLPEAAANDLLLIEHAGETAVVSVGTLIAGLQPTLSLAPGSVLGRIGPMVGGPEAINVGPGLAIAGGQIKVDPTVVASLNSPALTGRPTAPTQSANDASSAIATTAFVQSHSVPPASAVQLGSVKIGSGLVATGDGTTSLAPILPAVDGSALKVTAGFAGASARALSDIRGEVIRVADILGAKPTGQDATSAMVTALGLAANMPGSTVELAAGTWNFASLSAGLVVPSRTSVRGAGRHLTKIIWNDTGVVSLFGSSGSGTTRAFDIEFSDFTVAGSWQTNFEGSAYPFLMRFVDGLLWRNVCSEYSRVMGVVARNCTNVTAQGCVVRYCARDGINFAECSAVTIDGNTVEHCDDDGIAVHSDVFDPWLVRKNIVVSNNRLFGCQGIKVLAPRSTAVVGNVVDCCRSQGISFATVTAAPTDIEGLSAAMVSLICGNVVTNVINRQNIDNLNQGAPGIIITGNSARAGTAGAVPGEAKITTSTVVDPYPYQAANSSATTVATPGSHSIIVANNFVGRILPACNGTVTTPKLYARFSDYGFGQMFTRTGFVNPRLAENDMSDHAIRILGGVVRDVLLANNVIRGMTAGLALLQATRLENIAFRGNHVIDCRSFGVLVNTTGVLRAYIEDNIFDLDPFFRSSGRGAHGTWSTLGEPTGVKVTAGSGSVVRRNIFRNLCRDSDVATDDANSGWLFTDNIVEADPVAVGFSTANVGVGQVRAAAGAMLMQVDGNPGSSTFGAILTPPTSAAVALPNGGKWLVGHFLRNAAPQAAGGLVNLGWSRLTTGTGNVLGTDWSQALTVSGTVSSSLVLAGPTSGSAATPTFRQLSAADVAGVLPVPTVTNSYSTSGAINPTDNLALVNASIAVSMTLDVGATDGHSIVVKRFGVGPVTLTATIDGTAGTQVMMNSAAVRESISLVWSQALASWLMI